MQMNICYKTKVPRVYREIRAENEMKRALDGSVKCISELSAAIRNCHGH